MIREKFEAQTLKNTQRDPDTGQYFYCQDEWVIWQAACNLFLNHVEIVPDDWPATRFFINGKYAIKRSEFMGGECGNR